MRTTDHDRKGSQDAGVCCWPEGAKSKGWRHAGHNETETQPAV
jgi:hypothetical protein